MFAHSSLSLTMRPRMIHHQVSQLFSLLAPPSLFLKQLPPFHSSFKTQCPNVPVIFCFTHTHLSLHCLSGDELILPTASATIGLLEVLRHSQISFLLVNLSLGTIRTNLPILIITQIANPNSTRPRKVALNAGNTPGIRKTTAQISW